MTPDGTGLHNAAQHKGVSAVGYKLRSPVDLCSAGPFQSVVVTMKHNRLLLKLQRLKWDATIV